MTLTIDINQTASSGAWSFNTQKFTENVYLRQIIIKTATVTSAFDFYVQDGTKNSNLVFDTRTEGVPATGTLRREVNIPLAGIHTIGVVNAETDEVFTGKIIIEEKK